MEERPVLAGTVLVGDTAMTDGTVVLHHLSDAGQGQLDSLPVGGDGSFEFVLPNVPDPTRSDVFFASVRHAGVLYFGPAVTTAVQLDSLYEVRAWDTLMAPAEGASVAIQSRSVFLEPDTAGAWRATDLFQIRNDRDRTVVAREGGRTWSYPLPEAATDVAAGEGDLSFEAASYEDGELVVRAALPPGERYFVVRYRLPTPFISFPTPGVTETLDVLVREPAPALEIEGVTPTESIELEPGSTYRRFTGTSFERPFVSVVQGDEPSPPPVQWIAVILALVLAAGGLVALRAGRGPSAAAEGATDATVDPRAREALLMRVARLDEEFHAVAVPSEAERRRYERRRAELMQRLRAGG